MNTLNIILILIFSIIIIFTIAFLIYKTFNNKIKVLLNKIDYSEELCINQIKEKTNIVLKLIDIVETKLSIESKTFNSIKELNIDKINSFKYDEKLNKCYDEIIKISIDNNKSKKLKNFKSELNKYEQNELTIISLRTYYNKYACMYNNLIKKFPYNIICIIKKYKLKLIFSGEELDNNY